MVDTDTQADFFEDGNGGTKSAKRQQKKADKARRQARRNPKPLEPRNDAQRAYVDSLHSNALTFGIGPAGSGKTYVPARVFGQMLSEGRIDKLYIARPNVAKSKHRLGYLPGSLEEKTAPWLVPIFEGLRESMGPTEFERYRREKRIEEVPYEFIQGRTFKDAACIVDEAENLDLDDLYITLTRQGEGLSMVLCGDPNQARVHDSGLLKVVNIAKEPWMEEIGVIEFTEKDVVRSKQAKQWVTAFNRLLNNTENYGMDEFTTNPPPFLRKE